MNISSTVNDNSIFDLNENHKRWLEVFDDIPSGKKISSEDIIKKLSREWVINKFKL